MNVNANKDVIKLPDKSEQNLIALFASIIVTNTIKKVNENKKSHSISAQKQREAK